jgi:ABC-type branched-subunit amino acid transport system substrate-binding protein
MVQRHRRLAAFAAPVAAFALALTGCASSSSRGDSGEITVMAIGTIQSAQLSLPDAQAAMQAHVAQINDSGGINGRKINLVVCDDKFDPNTAADCARQAVSQRVAAVIWHYQNFSPQVTPVLEAAKIPMVYTGVADAVDGTSSVSFPRDSGIPGFYGALGIELGKAGCRKAGAVVTSQSTLILGATWLERGLKAQNAELVQVSVGQTQPDFAAPVAKLLSQGIDCLVPVTAPDQGPKVVAALAQSGQHLKLGAITSEFSTTALAALGSSADGMIITGQEYRPSDTDVPAVKEIVDGLQKYQPSVPLTTKFGVAAWASVTALQQVLTPVQGPVTSSSVLAAVTQATVDTKLYAKVSYSSPALMPQFPQIKNWNYLVWTVKGGKAVLDKQDFTPLTTGL